MHVFIFGGPGAAAMSNPQVPMFQDKQTSSQEDI